MVVKRHGRENFVLETEVHGCEVFVNTSGRVKSAVGSVRVNVMMMMMTMTTTTTTTTTTTMMMMII